METRWLAESDAAITFAPPESPVPAPPATTFTVDAAATVAIPRGRGASDSICYMRMEISDRLRADARAADELHERSRTLLTKAAREGAAAGLSQREIARAIGRSQPEVSRLLHFHGSSDLGRRLTRNRRKVLELLSARGIRNARVFGSVARGTDRPDSDIDLLVDLPAETSLFTLARLEHDLTEVLGAKVDIVPADTLRRHLSEQVLKEAIPL